MTHADDRTAPAWLVEGATVAVTHRGAYTRQESDVELHKVTRVGKATCTISTGGKYSIRTLEEQIDQNTISYGRLHDPEDPMIRGKLQRQERAAARALVHKAYEAFQKHASPERTQALMDHLAAYQALATVGD